MYKLIWWVDGLERYVILDGWLLVKEFLSFLEEGTRFELYRDFGDGYKLVQKSTVSNQGSFRD